MSPRIGGGVVFEWGWWDLEIASKFLGRLHLPGCFPQRSSGTREGRGSQAMAVQALSCISFSFGRFSFRYLSGFSFVVVPSFFKAHFFPVRPHKRPTLLTLRSCTGPGGDGLGRAGPALPLGMFCIDMD